MRRRLASIDCTGKHSGRLFQWRVLEPLAQSVVPTALLLFFTEKWTRGALARGAVGLARGVLCALREGMASSSINPLTNRPYSQRYYSILEVRIA